MRKGFASLKKLFRLFGNYIVNAVIPLFQRKISNHPSVLHWIKKESVKEDIDGGKSEAVLYILRIFPCRGSAISQTLVVLLCSCAGSRRPQRLLQQPGAAGARWSCPHLPWSCPHLPSAAPSCRVQIGSQVIGSSRGLALKIFRLSDNSFQLPSVWGNTDIQVLQNSLSVHSDSQDFLSDGKYLRIISAQWKKNEREKLSWNALSTDEVALCGIKTI